MDENRKRIQTFIDWLIDNKKDISENMFSYMEEYLVVIKKENVENIKYLRKN